MRKYAFVCMGGALGAILRYAVANIRIWNYNENFPLNTLFINISGSFALSVILSAAFVLRDFNPDIKTGLSVGLLGAFTTFSALCKEIVRLAAGGFYYSALSYITMSAVLGLASAYFGVVLAEEATAKLAGKWIKFFGKIRSIAGIAEENAEGVE